MTGAATTVDPDGACGAVVQISTCVSSGVDIKVRASLHAGGKCLDIDKIDLKTKLTNAR